MRRAAATVLATAALTAGLGLPGAGVAFAAVGDPAEMEYPGTTTPPGQVLDRDEEAAVGGTTTTRTRTRPRAVTSTRATLPFTGGELVLVATAGAGAVGAGAALVVASRRRGPQSA